MATGTEADIKALREEIQELREGFTSVRDTLRDLARHSSAEAATKARESGERLLNEAKRRANGLSHEIEEKPVTAALTAFSIGMLLGLIFSGRRG